MAWHNHSTLRFPFFPCSVVHFQLANLKRNKKNTETLISQPMYLKRTNVQRNDDDHGFTRKAEIYPNNSNQSISIRCIELFNHKTSNTTILSSAVLDLVPMYEFTLLQQKRVPHHHLVLTVLTYDRQFFFMGWYNDCSNHIIRKKPVEF